MSSLFRLEQRQKTISFSVWGNREPFHGLILFDSVCFSFFLHLEWNDKSAFIKSHPIMALAFIHSCSSLENHTRFQAKMGEVYTRFQTKTAQKPYLLERHITIWFTKGSALTLPPSPPRGKYKFARASHCFLHFLHVAARHRTEASNRSLTTWIQLPTKPHVLRMT